MIPNCPRFPVHGIATFYVNLGFAFLSSKPVTMNGRRSLRSSSSNTQLPTKAPEARPRRKKGTASVPATEAIHEESPAQDSSGSHITKPEIKPKRKKATPALEVDESLPVIVQDNLDGFRVSGPLGEMPLEILSEVLKHLEPVSLLALLRTSRFLRAFLLNRSAASAIWKSVGPCIL